MYGTTHRSTVLDTPPDPGGRLPGRDGLTESEGSDELFRARLRGGERRTPWPATITLFVVFVAIAIHRYLVPVDDYVQLWGLSPARFWHGERLETLVTSAFAHAHLYHLVTNSFYFLLLGRRLEQHLGTRFVAALFFTSVIIGSLASVLIHPGSTHYAVGASGGVAGYLGALLVLAPQVEVARRGRQHLSMSLFLVSWLLLQVLLAVGGPPGIAYVAHIGGFVGGLAFAGVLRAFGLPRVVEMPATLPPPGRLLVAARRLAQVITEHPLLSVPVLGLLYMLFTALVIYASI
jgi:membrane associated rhomboid family serine protease